MALGDNMRGVVYMNIAMLAFSVNDTFMKAAMLELPLFQSIAIRGGLAFAALLCIAAVQPGGLTLGPPGRDRRVIGIRTLAEVVGTLLFLAALMHMPLANLSAILQSLPLAVTLAAAVVFKDKVGWRRMLAIGIGFVGVLMIVRPGTAGFDEWSLMGLGSVLAVVVRDLATRELSVRVPSVVVALWAAAAVTAMGVIGVALEGWQPVRLHGGLMLLGAAGALVVGYLYVIMVMRVGDIGFVAPFRYMALLWAILFGWVLFGTLPDGWTLIGSLIVVATGIYTLWRERRLRLLARAAGA